MPFSAATWNTLGLGVASSWVVLGLVAAFEPVPTARIFGVSPRITDMDTNNVNYSAMGLLIASRDLTIAATLFILGTKERNREMGAVISSTLIICATDIYLAQKAGRNLETGVFAVGALLWGAVGLGLGGFLN